MACNTDEYPDRVIDPNRANFLLNTVYIRYLDNIKLIWIVWLLAKANIHNFLQKVVESDPKIID